jgi:glycosyltransferase involved in cell wall biosynthesis
VGLLDLSRLDPSEVNERSETRQHARPHPVDVSLVVPFYNPGPVVRRTIERAANALDATGRAYEVIAVCDGSTDGSEATLRGVRPGVVRIIKLESNRGKGYAVRTGLLQARGRFVGFIDADGDIPPEQLTDFVTVAASGGADIVYGSKRDPRSSVKAPLLRRVFSRSYGGLIRLLFHLPVLDTQTGIKIVRADVASAVVPQMTEDGFAFDLELFVRAYDLGHRSFEALPVRIDKAYTTTISFPAAWTILTDSLRIYWRMRVSHAPSARPGTNPHIEEEIERARSEAHH